ncbi:TadE-like protein [Corynebacterium sp. 13CS0277]|uniref:Rv3654c family TadE-like protein n=1 Tax=Corynebacterium sp. 13CS0277 TaxID=2071994 RepID=UPI000D0271BD|nr:Rv3654c family TadE-like protein [Corynebacterium sp. 13CS0277]PRQ12171.1 TadE-like protein [Corynebacterium sp. 13CS0277]
MTRTLTADHGNATLLGATIAAALISLAAALVATVGHVDHIHRAQLAADLGSVAGATAAARGDDACAAARATADANAAQLDECRQHGGDVTVVARVRGAAATATAGPI